MITGALAASAGFAAVAAAGTSGLFALGIAFAGVSAGLCWAPFNDAAERVVPDEARATVLSVVSTRISFGVAAAGLALAVTHGALVRGEAPAVATASTAGGWIAMTRPRGQIVKGCLFCAMFRSLQR